MTLSHLPLLTLLMLLSSQAFSWSNHTFAAYRAFENMPEIAKALPVKAQPLEVFL